MAINLDFISMAMLIAAVIAFCCALYIWIVEKKKQAIRNTLEQQSKEQEEIVIYN